MSTYGENGLLNELTRRLLERAMSAEMTADFPATLSSDIAMRVTGAVF